MAKTLKQRFEEKVDYNGECFEWTGAYNGRQGNRRPNISLTIDGKEYNKKATHVAWFLEYGYWPTKQMNHRCDEYGNENKACVRISHLYDGSAWDNTRDAIASGKFKPWMWLEGKRGRKKNDK